MAGLAKLKTSHEHTVNDEFFRLYADAGDKQEKEGASVLAIQCAWRGFVVRRNLLKIMLAVGCLQSHYRGHLGRKRWATKQREVAKEERNKFFAIAAVQIQRQWRGFASRKRVHSFAARKAFLKNVLLTNDTLKQKMQENFQKQLDEAEKLQIEHVHHAFTKSITGKHHLLSTLKTPGIYNSPFAPFLGGVPRVGGIPLEQHLSQTLSGKLQIPRQKHMLPPLSKSGNLSIQAESPFDAVDEAKRQESVGHKIATVGGTPFVSTVKINPSVTTSINVGTPYDTKRSNPSPRQTKMKTSQDPTPFLTRVQTKDLFDDYGNPAQKLVS
mmetsp:Transcript_9926/g.11497  ORF Transcript_9926/g.11497 Transcript_9926/m.11497 type:complete len:326 (-) Transcript_9926:1133-2110(-)|eukprot:CAMPEP_0197855694 /NCGR_PEP_ID=MMETSP1438-20131217/27087_1 /TAXON_ID=1461541 /ORGANISM="Pterosperma sp., Strain CCMP1384" /LENGTH=325 /DNA_ID=CAMNT_0043470895 /DNA_START=542 /DNA_END=1519 /DNA_ORIENTATION=+